MQVYSTTDRIDEIYAQITKEESALKEKKLITISSAILVLFFILVSSFILTRDAEPLNIRQEQGSVNTSLFIEETSDASPASGEEDKMNLLQVEEELVPVTEKVDQSIKIEIRGSQQSVSELEFRILNFDPSFIYRVDFGNGEGKRVKESFTYSYNEAGLFEVKITAYGKDNSKKKVVQTLDIKPWEHA